MNKIRGNVLLYVLLGIALFGLLTYVVNDSAEGTSKTLSEEQAELYANQLINHAQQVQVVVQQMLMTGSTIDDLDFVKPGETGYDTAPHIHKVFHPGGGGAPVFNQDREELYDSGGSQRGWSAMSGLTNVEWTLTSATDVLYSFVDVNTEVCKKVNKILIAQDEVVDANPSSGLFNYWYFLIETGDNYDLPSTRCTSCEGVYSMCVNNSSSNAFYNIIASR